MTEEIPIQTLQRRAKAAAIDMSLISAICFAMEWSMRVSEPPRVQATLGCEIALGAIGAIELFTGWTLGKFAASLRVRKPSGEPASPPALILRGMIRLLPVAVFIPSLYIEDRLLSLAVWGISLTLVLSYICAAYVTLLRNATTLFDSISSTVVLERPPK